MSKRTWKDNPRLVEVEIDIIKDFIIEVGQKAGENEYNSENFLNAHHRAMVEVLQDRENRLKLLKEDKFEVDFTEPVFNEQFG